MILLRIRLADGKRVMINPDHIVFAEKFSKFYNLHMSGVILKIDELQMKELCEKLGIAQTELL